ncbi:MAG: response regulator, partial [Halobacteriaceae archaeon]
PEGHAILSDWDVDCIISSYDLPPKNGITFLKAVRQEYPDLPFILYPDKGSEEIASDAISAGVSDYLQKRQGTEQFEILANRIINLVAQHRAEGVETYTHQDEKNGSYKHRLLQIVSNQELTTDEKLQQLLALGSERFDVDNGHLVKIDPDKNQHTVVKAVGSDIIQKGVYDLSQTYCRKTIESDDIVEIYNAVEQDWRTDPAYESFGCDCYIGGKLSFEDTLYGTVCFVDENPREPLTYHEREFFDILVDSLTQLLKRRRLQQAEAIFDHAQDGLFLIDVNENQRFTVQRVNPAFEALTGLTASEIYGKSPPEI